MKVNSSGKYWDFDCSHLNEAQIDYILATMLDDMRIINQWQWGLSMKINLPDRLSGIGDCTHARYQRETKLKKISTQLFPLTEKEYATHKLKLESLSVRIDLKTYEANMQEDWDTDSLEGENEILAWFTRKDGEDDLKEFLHMCAINKP